MTDQAEIIFEKMNQVIPALKHCAILEIEVLSAGIGKLSLLLPSKNCRPPRNRGYTWRRTDYSNGYRLWICCGFGTG